MLPEAEVEVHGTGRWSERLAPTGPRASARSSRPGPIVRGAGVEGPTGRGSEQPDLIDRLAGAGVAQLGRPVRGAHHQRHSAVAGFEHCGWKLAAAVPDVHTTRPDAPWLWRTESEERHRPLVEAHVDAEPTIADQRQRQWRGARTRSDTGITHPGPHPFVDQGP